MYEKIFAKYLKNGNQNIMFFEGGQYPDEIGAGNKRQVNSFGFTNPPGAQNGSLNHVLNDHSYCCQMNEKECATGEPSFDHDFEVILYYL